MSAKFLTLGKKIWNSKYIFDVRNKINNVLIKGVDDYIYYPENDFIFVDNDSTSCIIYCHDSLEMLDKYTINYFKGLNLGSDIYFVKYKNDFSMSMQNLEICISKLKDYSNVVLVGNGYGCNVILNFLHVSTYEPDKIILLYPIPLYIPLVPKDILRILDPSIKIIESLYPLPVIITNDYDYYTKSSYTIRCNEERILAHHDYNFIRELRDITIVPMKSYDSDVSLD